MPQGGISDFSKKKKFVVDFDKQIARTSNNLKEQEGINDPVMQWQVGISPLKDIPVSNPIGIEPRRPLPSNSIDFNKISWREKPPI